MTTTKTSRRSFAGGEVTPEMYGRIDNIKNQTGLALCRNAVVLPHGPVSKRPGLAFVNIARDASAATRLLPFVFSATQSMVLEFGVGAIRFHTAGASLLETAGAISGFAANVVNQVGHGYSAGDGVWIGGRTYEVSSVVDTDHYRVVDLITGSTAVTPSGSSGSRLYTVTTPYTAAHLFELKITQDADVLTVSHPSYPTYELRRLGATNWTFTAPSLGAALTKPTGTAVIATAGTGTAYNKNLFYVVTTVSADGKEESLASVTATVANDLTLVGAHNDLSWVAPVGVTSPRYRVYKAVGSADRLMGFIAETTGLAFVDDNVLPDYSRNPPAETLRLDTAGKYPGAVAYFDQRRVFAGSTNDPQGVQMSRPGTESNFSVSYPAQSGDAISFRIKAQQQNAIRHLVPMDDLLALTANAVWRIYATGDGAILPNTVTARPQTYGGASHVSPMLTGSAVLFVESSGKRVRDISYSTEARGYITDDRAILAPHLFNNYTLTDAAFQRDPDRIAWFVRSDGALLSLTYLPEQQVYAWAQHTTDGEFESVCAVPEDNQDALYAVVRRTLKGVTTRTIERMASREFATLSDAFFVDCGLTYEGAAADTISGLWHLEGLTVAALTDGGVLRDLLVTDGTITLPIEASKVTLGLPFAADVQTLPLAVDAAEAGGQGTVKSVSYAYLLMNRSGVMEVGPDEDHLREVPGRSDEPWDSPPDLKNEEIDVLLDGDWTRAGQMWVRSADPVPFTLSALVMQVHLAS